MAKERQKGKRFYARVSTTDRMERLLSNASLALRESTSRKETRKFLKKSDARVIYLYDTDIILTYCAPWMSSRYGEIVPSEVSELYYTKKSTDRTKQLLENWKRLPEAEREKMEVKFLANKILHDRLAFVLARYVIKLNLLSKHPLPVLQFRRQYYETNKGVFETVKSKAEEVARTDIAASENRDQGRLKQLLLNYRNSSIHWQTANSNKDVHNLLDQITEEVLRKFRLNSDSAVAEWDRFVSIDRDYGGIFRIADLKDSADIFDLSESELDNRESRRAAIDKKLKKYLLPIEDFSKILEEENKNRDRDLIINDAESLQYLYAINTFTKAENKPIRFVLITGDFNLLRCAYRLSREEQSPTHDFATKYLRHLWSFLPEALAASKEDNSLMYQVNDYFKGLLNLTAGSNAGNFSFDDSALEDIFLNNGRYARYTIGSDSKNIKNWQAQLGKAEATWNEHAREAHNRDFLIDFNDQKLLRETIERKLQEYLYEYSISWSTIEEAVIEAVEQTRDRAELEFSDIGADFLVQQAGDGVRNPPDLYFDRLKYTQYIFDRISKPREIKTDRDGNPYLENSIYSSIADFNEDFANISIDCGFSPGADLSHFDDRFVNHLKYLVLSALYASSDKWLLALDHSERALKILTRSHDRIPTPSGVSLSGREASFLAAVAARMLVKHKGEKGFNYYLEKSEQHLMDFESAYKTDFSIANRNSLFRYDHSTPRLLGEKLAMALTKYYCLRKFYASNDETDETDENRAFRYCNSEAKVVFEQCYNIWDKYREDIFGYSQDSEIRLGTMVTLAVNTIQTFVISEFRKFHRNDPNYSISDIDLNLAPEFLNSCVRIVNEYTDYPAEIGLTYRDDWRCRINQNTSRIACSKLSSLYTMVGSMILQSDDYFFPSSKSEYEMIRDKIGGRDGLEVTSYDDWRLTRLDDFAFKLMNNS